MFPEKKIKVGCCGFPVARQKYLEHFSTVELNSVFYQLPKPETVLRWREEVPAAFEFSVKAWQGITHPASSPTYERMTASLSEKQKRALGHFQGTMEVEKAWEDTARMARTLQARFILFQTPASFYPNANTLRDFYRFFKKVKRDRGSRTERDRGDFLLVWEPRGSGWENRLVKKVCQDLQLVRGSDPLHAESAEPVNLRERYFGNVQYFRLHGAYEGRRIQYSHGYEDQELKQLIKICEDKTAYLFFNNASMWQDAQKFQELIMRDEG
ncbi:MAG: DUF72 domain-containing protein [Elusimicrobia bacterium]|nr:DUF72 domain-containing protein [Elusimicrobiota bacterium]